MTSLPSDVTLISLPPGPLLKIVCLAAQKQLTGAWLSLISMLVAQLDPPSLLPPRFKMTNEEAQVVISQILPGLLQDSLMFLGQLGVMEDVSHRISPITSRSFSPLIQNPDIVQGFFSCMESVSPAPRLHPAAFHS